MLKTDVDFDFIAIVYDTEGTPLGGVKVTQTALEYPDDIDGQEVWVSTIGPNALSVAQELIEAAGGIVVGSEKWPHEKVARLAAAVGVL